MPWWQWLVDVAGLCLLLLFVYGLMLLVRRRLLTRGLGTFELSYRAGGGPQGRGWVLGLGRYVGSSLEFHRIFGIRLRPMRVFPRELIGVEGRRVPEAAEQRVLYSGHLVVRCRVAEEQVDLAMAPDALTGLLSWLEAAPPGRPPRAPRGDQSPKLHSSPPLSPPEAADSPQEGVGHGEAEE